MSIKINSTELKRVLEITPASQNIMLVGKHGIGKSEILEKFYTGKGYKVVPLFLGHMSDPGDLIGLLNKNEKTGKTEFMPPYWFPTDNQPVVLFLDELNRARPEVLQTIMDLALNRKLAGRSLPEGSRIISAVNNGEEYQLTDLDPALVSRFNVFEFVPSVSEWLLWATENKLDSRVIKFISENPSYLDGAELRKEDMGLEKSPDRRAWTRLAEILNGVPDASDEVYKKISAGIVGMAAATKFFASLSGSKILSAAEILLGKFDKVSEKLKSYTTPELAIENENLYRFIESKSYDESKSKLIAENFTKYFALLVSEIKQEALGHFANQFTAGMYPSTVVFIMTNAPDLYKKLNRFIKDL
ncbi:MAG: AAA family ATPase [Treponema sp.]|nr:AAA family ATPase [Treponema sp.]